MRIQSSKPIYWLERHRQHVVASDSLTHLFRVIARALKKRMSEVGVKEAIDQGFRIIRA
jgi:Leu/Phe-tRNA-protein transferase